MNAILLATLLCSAWTLAVPPAGRSQEGPSAEHRKPQKRIQALPLPVHPAVRVPRGRIHVDGSLSEWPGALPGLMLDHPLQVSGTAHSSWRGPKDLAGRGSLLWDEERLYLGFVILDDWARPFRPEVLRSLGLPPPGDTIRFLFDPFRDSRHAGPDPGRKEDFEILFGRDREGTTRVVLTKRQSDRVSKAPKIRAVLTYDKESKRYTLEAAIPWSEFPGMKEPPREGSAFDLQVVINDFDAVTDPLPQSRIGWTFGCGPVIAPFVFGTVVLAGRSWKKEEPPRKPPPPSTTYEPESHRWWVELREALNATRATEGGGLPAGKRLEILRALDRECSAWPRQDFLEMLMRMQRRQNRELAGWTREGPPWFFREVMIEILRGLSSRPAGDRPEITALPGRGWLIRSKAASIAIDPCMPLTERLHDSLTALCYTAAQDPLQRSDPLAFRMVATKKPVLAHVAFHLPGAGPLAIPPVDPGSSTKIGKEVEIRVLGKKDAEGKVTLYCGFQLRWPSGFTLVQPSLSGTESQVRLPPEGRIDVLILDPDHPRAEELLGRLKPRTVLLEGYLDGPRFLERSRPRNHALVEALDWIRKWRRKDRRVLLLAPGETFTPR